MAHAIDMVTGRAGIAYVGETPWHGLGQKLTANAPLELWQQEAGLDWEALKATVKFDREAFDSMTGEKVVLPSADKSNCVMYRSDTGLPLSIVSDRYQPVQPREVIEFYRDLTERHGFIMDTAGSIKEGRKIWALARTGESAVLPGNDRMESFLLLATSFDGSMATQARFTSVRVVCNNTLTAAISGRPDVSIRHSTSFNANDVKMDLKVGDAWSAFIERTGQMAETGVTPAQTVKLLLAAYHDLDTDEKIAKAKEDDKKAESLEKFIDRMGAHLTTAPGANLKSARGTLWGVMNAVTYDFDHAARSRTRDNRLDSAWFGRGEAVKRKMWEAINAHMGVAA